MIDSSNLSLLDGILIGSYFLFLIVLTVFKKSKKNESDVDFHLGGRSLTLPAFIATLVSTWYGGILGVGEFGYLYGLSQWVIFGIPYYMFALLFTWFIVPRIKQFNYISIPDALETTYGKAAKRVGSIFIVFLTSPAPYIIIVSYLTQFLYPGWTSFIWLSVFVTLFSMFYVLFGGFKAVVRTDLLQVILMFSAFIILVSSLVNQIGPINEVFYLLDSQKRSWSGGNSWSFILVWFFIALWTFVDPGFHQRVSAAKTIKIAQRGILLSVFAWFIFDMLTLSASLYGIYVFSELQNPALVYPELAVNFLDPGWRGLFFVGILATVMSTLDSFLFLSGQTMGLDFIKSFKSFKKYNGAFLTRWGIAISSLISILITIVIPDIIQLWYTLGTLFIPGLLIAFIGIYFPSFRVKNHAIAIIMVNSFMIALVWYLFRNSIPENLQWIEPFYPGMISGIFTFAFFKLKTK